LGVQESFYAQLSGKKPKRNTAMEDLKMHIHNMVTTEALHRPVGADLGWRNAFPATSSTRSHPIAVEPPEASTAGHCGPLPELAFTDALGQLEVEYEADQKILWEFMTPAGRPCFTPELLRNLEAMGDILESAFARLNANEEAPVSFLVLGSRAPGVFNLGGDLILFLRLIEERNREELRAYARACATDTYRVEVNLNLPICTIALVQGDALGGGFEAALAHDVIIAERSAKFGLPEVLFNLFPGMGAYNLLARLIGAAKAEKMILSGRMYGAEELYEMGIVERVVDDGAGIDAVRDFVKQYNRTCLARQAVYQTRRIVHPITHEDLIRIADLWVETAMDLTESDLRRMRHLAKAQQRRWTRPAMDRTDDEARKLGCG
jgi:DSF synthase